MRRRGGSSPACYALAVDLDRAALEAALGVAAPEGVDSVSGVTYDSRAVEPGYAFVAVPGFKHDGTEFAAQAMARGAALIVAERAMPGVPTVVVPDARAAMAELARAVFDDPSAHFEVYGITGTNGKTTTSYVFHSILATAYGPETCGLMGTAEVIIAGQHEAAHHTTPESTEVQANLARMDQAGVRRAVMEVSSHGIHFKRATGTHFAGALFTNLTRDHLDIHGSMEAYYRTKRELFTWAEGPKLANAEDAWGRRLSTEIAGVKTFGGVPDADYRVEQVRPQRDGTLFDLRHPHGVVTLHTPLLGAYNVLNVAGAAALAIEIGVEPDALVRAVRDMEQVPGRFERVTDGVDRGFEVIVDYAHTDVGLEAVLQVARETADATRDHPQGRVICVFGAAGERDTAKRPLMGRVASRLADISIITTDDAYSEDPQQIANAIAAESDPDRSSVIVDRRDAILAALRQARHGDVIVVAGKGHERVQHLPGGDVPFHDATVVAELLAELDHVH